MTTKNTLHRIKEYIDYKGISIRKFEESVGFSNGSFGSQYKNNKTIGVDKVEYILQTYKDINPVWLLTGHGSMLLTTQEQAPDPVTIQSVSPTEESFIYKMYKEKENKIDELNAKIAQMAEEIGSLKAQLDNQNNRSELPIVAEKTNAAFTPGIGAESSKEMKEATYTKISILPTNPSPGKR